MYNIRPIDRAVCAALAVLPLTARTAVANQEKHYEVAAGTGLWVNEFHEQGKTDLIVNSLPTSTGSLLFPFPQSVSWTGATTIGHGALVMSILGGAIQTTNQESWAVGPGASLFGVGSLGLAPGERVGVAGSLGMSGDDPLREFTIGSDLAMQAGSTMILGQGTEGVDRFHVTGLLDLSSNTDSLSVNVNVTFYLYKVLPSNIIATYGSRVGEFGTVTGLQPGWSIAYTSPPNAGPGHILLLIPEPTALTTLTVASLFMRRRTRAEKGVTPASAAKKRGRGNVVTDARMRRDPSRSSAT